MEAIRAKRYLFIITVDCILNKRRSRSCGSALFKDSSVLLGLESADVNLAVLQERVAVDVGADLLKEGLDVS